MVNNKLFNIFIPLSVVKFFEFLINSIVFIFTIKLIIKIVFILPLMVFTIIEIPLYEILYEYFNKPYQDDLLIERLFEW